MHAWIHPESQLLACLQTIKLQKFQLHARQFLQCSLLHLWKLLSVADRSVLARQRILDKLQSKIQQNHQQNRQLHA